MASRFQNVTDADVGAIKNAPRNVSLVAFSNLQFMLQNVLTRSLNTIKHISISSSGLQIAFHTGGVFSSFTNCFRLCKQDLEVDLT